MRFAKATTGRANRILKIWFVLRSPQKLLARAASQILELRLPALHLAALRLADNERAATDIYGFVKLIGYGCCDDFF